MRRWVAIVIRVAWPIVAVAVVAIPAMTWYAATHLSIDTSTADMIAERLPWRQYFSDYRTAFPQLDHNLVAVIDAPDADHADDARDALYAALSARDDLFDEVFAPGSDVFFRRNAFLYLETAELRDLSDRLAVVQPLLARLAADPTTAGLFNTIRRSLSLDEIEVDLSPVLGRLSDVVEAHNRDQKRPLSWQSLISAKESTTTRRVVVLTPRLDFSTLHPAREAIEVIRQQEQFISATLPASVRIRLTGPVALEFEELVSVTRGAKLAGMLALGMVLVILYFALRSVWLVFAALLTLVTGLLATAVFAALAIGSLNLISIAFAVLYIGLGIDFAIHYCLRYREAITSGVDKSSALIDSAGDVGASLILCAVTTSVGFYAFSPTTFTGVSELGIISGTGMFISLVVTLTLLPALLRLLPAPQAAPVSASASAVVNAVQKITRYRFLLPVAAGLTVAALLTTLFARFDSNPLNLRDNRSESVRTFVDLLDDPQYSPQSLSFLTHDTVAAGKLRRQLEQAASVRSTRSIADLVPANQPEKLALIDEINWLIGSGLNLSATPANDPDRDREAIAALSKVLAQRSGDAQAQRLAGALDVLLQRATGPDTDQNINALSRMLVGTLPGRLSSLDDALDAQTVTLTDLPEALRQRWIATDGRQRIEIIPRASSAEFVDQVRSIVPAATGLPVVQREAGNAVVSSFRQAFITAFILISLILVLLLRNWRQVIVVLVPMVVAGLGTVAVMVLIDQPFNFANVIALPLLLGVGVDNGIHMVHRWRSAGESLLASSTSRAILFSALTTIASFGNLAFSSHPGSASMGTVLAIGMMLTTLCTILLIPALLRRQTQ